MRMPLAPQRRRLLRICTLVVAALVAGCTASGTDPAPLSYSSGLSPLSSSALPASALTASAATDASSRPPPRREVLELALRAYACGRAQGTVRRPVLAVIDYSLPSTLPRFWLVDARTGRIERSELVAHGQGSGDLRATRFSNALGSHRSSLGLFVTGETYAGRYGRSLRLHGLEPGVNDAAYQRAIVIHGAWYVSESQAARFGRLGRSYGCPALSPEVAPEVLDALADGAALFVYGDDPDWLAHEPYLQCDPVHAPPLEAASAAARAAR